MRIELKTRFCAGRHVRITVLYSRFKHCAKDVFKVTAQPTILESIIVNILNVRVKCVSNFNSVVDQKQHSL